MEKSTITEILQRNKVKGVFHTHVSMGKIKGKYQFNRQDLEEFWDVYINQVNNEEEEKKESNICIAEKPQQYLPVLADIDIKIRETEDSDLCDVIHTDKHVKEVVEVYQSTLRNILEDCCDKKLTCVLLEKPLYRVNKNGNTYAKHGFHLHFPYCFLNKMDQEVQLIPRVQNKLNDMKTFNDIGFEDSGKIIDNSCCKVPWLLYGSVKEDGMFPYKVTKIFNSDMEEISIEDAFNKYQLFDKQERLINIKGKVKEYLPRILSIIPYGRPVCELRSGLISPLKEKNKEKEKKRNNNNNENREYKKQSIIENLNIAKKLLSMLSSFRASDRNEWMTIGWILYNIGNGNQESLDLWCEFSSRCEEQYNESVCIYQWERMVKKDLTIGTLRYFASVDSPEKYREFKMEESVKYINESLNGAHNDIAKILYSEYGNEFVCVSPTSRIWFQFVGHKWEQIDDGIYLREKISGEIVQRFSDMGKDILGKLSGCTDKGEEAMHNARLKLVQKMIGNLKSSPYKTNVMKEAAEVFYDPRFKEKLDTNPSLFPFKNGIYDLTTNIFRSGRPEDFISKCSPVEYVEYDEDDDCVIDVYDFLEKVFPDKSVRKYFMDISSDLFLGGNHEKNGYFWTGEGDNGKTVTQNLLEKMLGKLAIKFNTTVITGKKVQSGCANPELARAGGGVRMAVLEEPNSDEQINVGIFKLLTGNDSYYARDLFEKGKEGREITPMFKLIFICNKLPKLKGSDKATWNRVRVVPFESTFCRESDPAPESYEEQLKQKRFPMDKNFSEKIPKLIGPLAWVLLKHRQTIKERTEPDKVRAATEVYRKQNDIYRQFIEEWIVEDEDKYVSLTDLYNQFKFWFRENQSQSVPPIRNDVEDYFIKLWGEPNRGKKWINYRLRTEQDDINDGEIVILEENDLIAYNKNLPVM